jgi:hypothetical protein
VATTNDTMRLVAQIQWACSDAKSFGTVSASGQIDVGTKGVYTHGTGASAANKVYVDRATVAASTSTTWDLSAALEDPVGNTVVFTTIKSIWVVHDSASLSSGIVAFDTVANYAVQRLTTLAPGGIDGFSNPSSAGLAVTAGTADMIEVTNSDASNAATVHLIVFGE